MNFRIPKPIQVRTITRHNFLEEFNAIHWLLNATPFKFASIDTEYPGHIFHATRTTPRHPAAVYSLMKANVDDMKLIQVGITISDAAGNLPHFSRDYVYMWEVLISDFDPEVDWCNDNSISLLVGQGVDLRYNLENGISPRVFANRLKWCGLVGRQNSPIKLITFNAAYDFGYLIKLLTEAELPESLPDFLGLVKNNFGNNIFDVKHMTTRLCLNVWGGLDTIAARLGVTRVVQPGNRTASNAFLALQMFHEISRGRDELSVMGLAGQIHNLCD